MRRAFISYSLADKDRFVVSRLTTELQRKDMLVTSSQNFDSPIIDFTTQKNIEISDLFLGVITDQSHTPNRVLNEWQYANQRNVPGILVVENTLNVQNIPKDNVIFFDRTNLGYAIDKVNQKIEFSSHSPANEEWIKWVLGGAAVLALLSVLGKNK
ncbi:MAG TPA: hypothetical protein VK563_07170 [Puia sp.]|nr:hypothetical protein [Puia sp.]